MTQSNLYKRREQIERIHDIVGGDVPRDAIKTIVSEQDQVLDVMLRDHQVDVEDRDDRALGVISIETGETVTVQEDDPIEIDADDMEPVTATTDATGEAEAAEVDLGPHRKDVDVYYSTTDAATVTIEVSTDTEVWRELETVMTDTEGSSIVSVSTAYQHVRAFADANVDTIEVTSKGS